MAPIADVAGLPRERHSGVHVVAEGDQAGRDVVVDQRAEGLAQVFGYALTIAQVNQKHVIDTRRGIEVPVSHTERDWRQPYAMSKAVEQAWLTVYRAPKQYWDLYQLGEELTDLEDAFRLWRFRHLTTVERVIGFKRGTGGTGGISYLRKMLDVVLFPEIWALRTEL